MKLILHLIFIAFLLGTNSFAQKNIRKKYEEQLEPNSRFISGTFNTTLEETLDGKFLYKKYYPDTKMIIQLITGTSKSLEIIEGLYVRRYDDGTVVEKGMYSNNQKQGLWIESINTSGLYVDDQKQGIWKQMSSDSILISEKNYVKGNLHGLSTYYNSTGTISYEEVYNRHGLYSTTQDTSHSIVETMPRFKGCEKKNWSLQKRKSCAEEKLVRFVYSNLNYPEEARKHKIQGKVYTQFTVTKEGDVADIKVLNGICKSIRKECIRVIKRLPKWIPGTRDGKNVDVRFTFPIQFKIM